MSIRLYVGNLPKEAIERQDLQAVFADAGDAVTAKVIKDRKTGKCRGFAFVTVPTDEMANELIEKHNGQAFMDTTLKIEKALPRSKGKSETAAPSSPPTKSGGASSSPGKRGESRGSSNKSRKTERTGGNSNSDTVQPDPRWADKLAELKEMLTAQAGNS
ncbi:MAG: RNA-binding protein [Cyanobacteriota bacterium]|nr:RNA-binding protein [Cyanobacteriota bacterium]